MSDDLNLEPHQLSVAPSLDGHVVVICGQQRLGLTLPDAIRFGEMLADVCQQVMDANKSMAGRAS